MSWKTETRRDAVAAQRVRSASRALVSAAFATGDFAAGNEAAATNALHSPCVAAWVNCVAAGNRTERTLADFSSRGVPGDPLHRPTLTAPDVMIASARATTGVVINALFALDVVSLGVDALHYAKASGTSMAAP